MWIKPNTLNLQALAGIYMPDRNMQRCCVLYCSELLNIHIYTHVVYIPSKYTIAKEATAMMP